MATEIAPRRLNVVSPGPIDTPMVALKGKEREALYANNTAPHAIPRAGTADEVAQGSCMSSRHCYQKKQQVTEV